MSERASVCEPRRVYAIGDIHGRMDLLEVMIGAIGRDLEAYPAASSLTLTLGDYIDRGPQSREVVERLSQNPFANAFLALKGNHETLLQGFLDEPSSATYWRRLGGLETLSSYGIEVGSLMRGKEAGKAAETLRRRLPKTHLDFFAGLSLSFSLGPYFFCHAGVRPGVPLARQSEEDLLWIREEFLLSSEDFGKIIVHGHSPREEPEVLPNRINVDTGAFITGRLTCAVLEGRRVRFLTAR